MDRRVARTRKQLREALIELLKVKSVQDITVCELADKVEISRGTFYLHYKNVFDMLETVEQAGANPCPPMVLGVGVGGDFEQVAEMAKRALMIPLDEHHADPFYAALEQELLEAVNMTGIGPQGLGGKTTCLGLHILAAPTHIAGLPVAVNVSCHVTRHATAVL